MLKYLLLSLFLGVSTTTAISCPPSVNFLPCTCDGESVITCTRSSVPQDWDVKGYFDELSASIEDPDMIFDKLYISGTELTEIPAGTGANLKFRHILIEINDKLESISPHAFEASAETATEIDLFYNNLSNDIFEFFTKFSQLELVYFHHNTKITAIPDNAFVNNKALTLIWGTENSITSIGSKAFANLPNLETLSLKYNNIEDGSIAPDAFEGIASGVTLDIQFNSLDHISSKFKPVLDAGTSVWVGNVACEISHCSWPAMVCDERADWLCSNDSYRLKLHTFFCYASPRDDTVWNYCDTNKN